MSSKSQLNTILGQVSITANTVFGEKLNSVILYGSYARGDYDNESDIDIMVLADVPRDEIFAYKEPFINLTSELGLQFDIVVTVTVKDVDTFNKYLEAVPFYQAVEKEGIKIAV